MNSVRCVVDLYRVDGFLDRDLSFLDEQHELNAIFVTHRHLACAQVACIHTVTQKKTSFLLRLSFQYLTETGDFFHIH